MYVVNTKEKNLHFLDSNLIFINEQTQANYIKNNGIPEINLINWCIPNFKNPKKTFIDIGAHIGTYSWSLAPFFKNVVSFEPNPEVYNCLCANTFLKGLSHKITTHCNGIGDKSYIATYNVRGTDGGGNGFAITELYDENGTGKTISQQKFEVRTLDSYQLDDIGFIKIDVEGFEKEVFLGAIETIKRNNYPPILFESWTPGEHLNISFEYTEKLRKELFKTIEEIGYHINSIRGWSEVFLATKKV